MKDLYLKFINEAAANTALFEKDAEDVLQSRYPEHSIDVIGTIYKRTGGTDEEPIMTALAGWHVNVRGPENKALEAFSVAVDTPSRVWA